MDEKRDSEAGCRFCLTGMMLYWEKNISTVLVQYWHLHDIGTKLHSLMRRHGCCLTAVRLMLILGDSWAQAKPPSAARCGPGGTIFWTPAVSNLGFFLIPSLVWIVSVAVTVFSRSIIP